MPQSVVERAKKTPPVLRWGPELVSGSDLLFQGVSPQVPSALEGLTTVFGMGTGVAPPLLPPERLVIERCMCEKSGDVDE